MEISLAAEKLFDFQGIEVTNSLLSGVIIVALVSLFAVIFSFRIKMESPSSLQLFLEMIIDGLKGVSIDIIGKKRAQRLFSFVFTFFVFIVLSNWFGLLPIVGPIVRDHPHYEESHEEIGYEEGGHGEEYGDSAKDEHGEGSEENHADEEHAEDPTVMNCIADRDCILSVNGIEKKEAFPVFRAPTSDVSGTLALSLVGVFSIHYLGFTVLRGGYLKKFFNFSDPIAAFVGILELISEIGKLVSFTFRLFGNIFAGEVLLLVITSISFGLATIPFLLLEVFVGFIQAFVFFMLLLVFISLAVQSHDH
ncbi:F0F1 ATP synthase subunit A [Candidatus Dojkabacteria bacterium]|nr:F0F1 ATP synthase subunit A [Candidatus Dojkabacteria bacterium]